MTIFIYERFVASSQQVPFSREITLFSKWEELSIKELSTVARTSALTQSLSFSFSPSARAHVNCHRYLGVTCNSQAPVYMEKSCPGREDHPPSGVNFSERLYEKNVDPFARAKSAQACSDCLMVCRSPLKPSQLFVSHVNRSPSFVRKWRKSWLAQGSSGRRVTRDNSSPFKRGLS